MIVKCVQNGLVATILVLLHVCEAFQEQVFDKNYLNNFMGDKPSFTKRLYTANIDGISFELHNPIILNNCGTIDPTFELDSSQSDYLPVSNELTSIATANNCTLMFPKIFIRRKQTDKGPEGPFAGFITVRALNGNRILDVTAVVLLPIPNTNNMKVIFNIDGKEYIVLNYFYLKLIFVAMLIITMLLVVVEVKDILDKIRENKYKKLQEQLDH